MPDVQWIMGVKGFSGQTIYDRTRNARNSSFAGSNCLTFDGSTTFIVKSDEADLSFTDGDDLPFSVSAWINTDDITTSQVIFAKCDVDDNSTKEWRLAIYSSKAQFAIFDSDDGKRINTIVDDALDDSTWIHIAGTYSGNKDVSGIKIYINGVAVDQTKDDNGYGAMNNTTADVSVGSQLDDGSIHTPFDGYICDVRLFDDELTSSEVTEIKNGGIDVATSNSLLMYPLAEGYGEVSYDVSGSGYHGTITDGAWGATQDNFHYNVNMGFAAHEVGQDGQDITVHPTAFDFGYTHLGTTSKSRIVITNISGARDTFNVALEEGAVSFTTDLPSQIILADGAAYTGTISYSPDSTAKGEYDTLVVNGVDYPVEGIAWGLAATPNIETLALEHMQDRFLVSYNSINDAANDSIRGININQNASACIIANIELYRTFDNTNFLDLAYAMADTIMYLRDNVEQTNGDDQRGGDYSPGWGEQQSSLNWTVNSKSALPSAAIARMCRYGIEDGLAGDYPKLTDWIDTVRVTLALFDSLQWADSTTFGYWIDNLENHSFPINLDGALAGAHAELYMYDGNTVDSTYAAHYGTWFADSISTGGDGEYLYEYNPGDPVPEGLLEDGPHGAWTMMYCVQPLYDAGIVFDADDMDGFAKTLLFGYSQAGVESDWNLYQDGTGALSGGYDKFMAYIMLEKDVETNLIAEKIQQWALWMWPNEGVWGKNYFSNDYTMYGLAHVIQKGYTDPVIMSMVQQPAQSVIYVPYDLGGNVISASLGYSTYAYPTNGAYHNHAETALVAPIALASYPYWYDYDQATARERWWAALTNGENVTIMFTNSKLYDIRTER